MKISLIVAKGLKNEIGISSKNCMPWHIKSDLKHFKEITSGHCVIMGRRCFESIGKALPNRTNVVVSNNPDFKAEGCVVKPTLQLAMDYVASRNEREVFIIGGATIYRQMMNTGCVDYLYVTDINQEFPEADVFFPEIDETKWKKEKTGEAHGQEGDDFDVDFYIYKNAKFY